MRHHAKHSSLSQSTQGKTKLNPLNDWVESHLSTPSQYILPHEIDEQSAAFLSRFGLKTPKAIDAFLKTPAGKTVTQEIRSQWYEKILFSEEQIAQYTAHELLLKRIKVALYQWDNEQKAQDSQQLDLLIEEQIQHSLKRGHTESEPTLLNYAQERYSLWLDWLQHTDQQVHETQTSLSQLNEKEQQLLKEQQLFDELELAIHAKYELYDSHLTDDFTLPHLVEDEDHFSVKEVNKAIESLSAKIQGLYSQINDAIEGQSSSEHLIHTQHAYHLQLHALRDWLSVHSKEKVYLDAFANKVNNPLKAHFILTPEYQLIYDDNTYFLLKSHQDWNEIKHQPEARDQAKAYFQDNQSALLTLKPMLAYQKKEELSAHQQQSYRNTLALSLIKSEQVLCENEIRRLQSLQAEIQLQLTKEQPAPKNVAALSPKPAPSSVKKTHTGAPSVTYKSKLNELKNKPTLTQQDLTSLAELAPGENVDKARQLVKTFFARSNQLTMQQRIRILAAMERFGSLPEAQKANQPADESQPYNSPTPFSKKPTPYQ